MSNIIPEYEEGYTIENLEEINTIKKSISINKGCLLEALELVNFLLNN
jgi:hypothetical protein